MRDRPTLLLTLAAIEDLAAAILVWRKAGGAEREEGEA